MDRGLGQSIPSSNWAARPRRATGTKTSTDSSSTTTSETSTSSCALQTPVYDLPDDPENSDFDNLGADPNIRRRYEAVPLTVHGVEHNDDKIQELMKSIGLSPEQDTAMSFDGDLSSLSVDILSIDVTVENLETCMEETLERLQTLGQPREVPSSIMKKRTEPFDTPNAALTSASKRGVRFALSGSCTEVQNLRLQQFMRGTRPVDTSTAPSEVSWCPTTPMSSPLDGKR